MRGILPPGKLCKDVFQHRSGLLQHVIVPVARYGETLGGKYGVTSSITLRFCVLASVNLDYQLLIEADEVKDVVLDRNLSAKFVGR